MPPRAIPIVGVGTSEVLDGFLFTGLLLAGNALLGTPHCSILCRTSVSGGQIWLCIIADYRVSILEYAIRTVAGIESPVNALFLERLLQGVP
jgi:hypothetical protein